jgi:DNA-binding SARP family transcriptional activator
MTRSSVERDDTSGGITLRLFLLGGFRAEVDGEVVAALAWRRRSARQLTKLLATDPQHALHREQIFDILWPNASIASARNSLAKAVHATRHALEPARLPRQHSTCLSVSDDMVALNKNHVLVDADAFQRAAHDALRLGRVPEYERALAMYTGPLLPEDRYEDWASERRRHLANLNQRLLLGLAKLRETEGDYSGAIDCLWIALQEDQTREDAHRQLMRLYHASGAPDLALRQFDICRAELSRQLNRPPHRETTALYDEILFGPAHQRRASS